MSKTVKLFTKPALQQLLRDFRKAGYTVTSASGLYHVYVNGRYDEKPVLTALNGSRGYLVTYVTSLLTEVSV